MNDPNEDRPGYKQTKVGWIPMEWRVANLSGVVDPRRPICYGVVQTGDPVPNGVPCVRVMDLVQLQLNPDGMITTSPNVHAQYKRTILAEGDVIVALRGEVGKAATVPKSLAGANLTRGVALLSMSPSVSGNYLAAALNGPYERLLLRRNTNGTALQEIPIESLRKIPIPLPPLAEQRKIAAILSTWDDAIEQARALIAAKKQQKKALMQQLLTGKRRLSGFEGEWTPKHLSSLVVRIKETADDPGQYPVLSITAGTGFVSQADKFSRVIAGKHIENYVLLRRGEFSYNKGNSYRYPQGCVYQLSEYDEGLVPSVFYSFRVKPKLVHDAFLKHHFVAGMHNEQIYRWVNTGVRNNGLLNLNATDFFALEIWLPTLDEQRAIADVLDTADREIVAIEATLMALEQQKKGLMQKLLTGQVRVVSEAKSEGAG